MERKPTLIENQKWIYHLSSMQNFESILINGLLSRSALIKAKGKFSDVADPQILEGRAQYGLDNHVPFHFFANNPFDGNVQTAHKDEDFFYVCVSRELAKNRGYKILAKHPLAKESPSLFEFADGFQRIDWQRMNTRDYKDQETKLICMAECLSPSTVPNRDFTKLVFRQESHEKQAIEIAKKYGININTWLNQNFFLKRS
ncbi:DUF4433 domain-containing protein [Pseudomonas sp. MM213]|uniref:DarT ssDNA thymidine ADP-ribosyltransferase family protein n=1 Tax=Pseudomonas sp. MM213 TaxID=2866807 RepID=UPI001CF3B7F4|nr:DarT ssDNA thymidine ADP-ribosyltransferase family protein [Pseudomonas sp. MM213]UCP12625.1 DUF4433 domain-containing protein [Pseudomonas sp. MM213]